MTDLEYAGNTIRPVSAVSNQPNRQTPDTTICEQTQNSQRKVKEVRKSAMYSNACNKNIWNITTNLNNIQEKESAERVTKGIHVRIHGKGLDGFLYGL